MKMLLASIALLAAVTSASIPFNLNAERLVPSPTHRSLSHGDVLAKVCNSSYTCAGSSCTTYRVMPRHCFTHIPGVALEFRCERFSACVSGEEYFGNTCSGYGRNYTTPCNTCMGGKYLQCTNEEITHYDCSNGHFHPGGTRASCSNLTACTKTFGPAPLMGGCATMPTRYGNFNVSLTLPNEPEPCHEIRVDQYFNNQCALANGTTHEPWHTHAHHGHHTHTGTPMPAPISVPTPQPNEDKVPSSSAVKLPPTPPPRHRHRRHHWAHHRVYYLPNGHCNHHEDSQSISVSFTCANNGHHRGEASAEEFPVATEEVMEVIQAELLKDKVEVMGPTLKRRHMQTIYQIHSDKDQDEMELADLPEHEQ